MMTEYRQRRLQAFEQLVESDPDVVVDALDITSEELCLAFPGRVRAYLDEQVGEDPTEELDDE